MIQRPDLVVVVTGLSGAGKSTALHALEDVGFFCVDNLPIPVVAETLAACDGGGVEKVALGIDVRVRSFLESAAKVLGSIEADGRRRVEIVFLDASDEALLNRFNSTRRPHPLRQVNSESREAPAVLDGVRLERERLSPLRANADQIIDTTKLSVHELRRRILSRYGPGTGGQPHMVTRIISFGFKYGAPVDADLVFDVRFIDNPYFNERLRPLTGKDRAVAEHVLDSGDGAEFLELVTRLLVFALPRYEREGKSYLTVAIGCTGGRHRSVAIAEALAPVLRTQTALYIDVQHRDITRDNYDIRESPAGSGQRAKDHTR